MRAQHAKVLFPQSTVSAIVLIAVVLIFVGLAGCQRRQSSHTVPNATANSSNPPGPPKLPAPSFLIAAPVPPSAILDGKDVRSAAPEVLRGMAYGHAGMGEYGKAAQCQYWFVQATDDGRYDLACWESLAGKVDAAMFWLQEAGQLAGVDSRWARLDPDLENVRNDPRWPTFLNYLVACERYWRVAGPKQTTLIVPEGYDRGTELALVVWLHGMGGNPAEMKMQFQSLANKHQIAFVGVSGTVPAGKTHFAWADVVEEDFSRVVLALADARKQIRWREGAAVALGFSQGAMVGLEVAVRHPEAFAGAITISAGSGSPVQLYAVTEKSSLSRQGFVIVCGDKENESSVERSNALEHWLKTGNANVLKPEYPNHAAHSFPADWQKQLPEWLKYIQSARKGKSP